MIGDYLGLGPMLGMSPAWTVRCGCCGPPLQSVQAQAATYNAAAAQAWANAVIWEPPAPEPGITWQPTGGKTWRVTITR